MPLKRTVIPMLFLTSLLLSATTAIADDVMKVHFIDVGQGDATLVEFPCGSMLIDTGGEKWPDKGTARYDSTPGLVDYLTRFFDSRPDLEGRLDLLLLTHPHLDHTRGVPAVVSQFLPRNVVYTNLDRGSGISEQR